MLKNPEIHCSLYSATVSTIHILFPAAGSNIVHEDMLFLLDCGHINW